MSARPKPTPEQSTAIGVAAADILLEAGAGSGKTSVLVDRYCNLVEELGSHEKVAAITFTERAAAEMRSRIRDRLREEAFDEKQRNGPDSPRAKRLDDLVGQTGGAWISTIHSLCQRIVAANAVGLGIDPAFRVLEGAELARLQQEAYTAALTKFVEADPEDEDRLELAATGDSLAGVASLLHTRLRTLGLPVDLPEQPPADIPALIDAFTDLAREALAEAKEMRAANARLSDSKSDLPRLEAATELQSDPDSVAVIDEAAVAALALQGSGAAFKGPACQGYRHGLAALASGLVERDIGRKAYGLIDELLKLYDTEFSALKLARSGLDFDDLQLLALDLLENSTTVRQEWHAQLRHLLVDEFQDTNRLQMRLINVLRGAETDVFCVGDELQSIYRFRNADVEVFRERRRDLSGDGPDSGGHLRLTGNFRSHPDVIAAVNRFGEAMFAADYVSLRRGRPAADFVPAQTAKGAGNSPAEPYADDPIRTEVLMVTDITGDDGWNTDNLGLEEHEKNVLASRAEFRVLSRRLCEMVDAGVCNRGDIVVLLRNRTHLAVLQKEFELAGLNPYIIAGTGYWGKQDVSDVRSILATIANPLDDPNLLNLLASPACGLTPDSIWLIGKSRRERDERLWTSLARLAGDPAASPLGADEQQRLKYFYDSIVELRSQAARLPLAGLTEAAVTRLGFDLALLETESGHARWANVRKLIRFAADYEVTEGRDLRGLIDHFESSAALDDRETAAATQIESFDGVRVMTIHAAKGLEFDVVCVPETGAVPGKGRSPTAAFVEVGADATRVGLKIPRLSGDTYALYSHTELAAADLEAELEEARRLAHVAFTRAKRHLIVSGTYKPGELDNADRDSRSILVDIAVDLGVTDVEPSIAVQVDAAEPALDTLPAEPAPSIRIDCIFPPESGRLERLTAQAPTLDSQPSQAGPGDAVAGRLPSSVVTRPPRRLSYSSLWLYARCPACFHRRQVLGLQAPDVPHIREQDEEDWNPPYAEPEDSARLRGSDSPSSLRYGPGNCLHRLLEASSRNNWRRPGPERIIEALAHEHLGPDYAERISAMLDRWYESPVFEQIKDRRVKTESAFLINVDSKDPGYRPLIGGFIDLLAEPGRNTLPLIIDYKTNGLSPHNTPETLMRYKYALQRDIYALALAGHIGLPNSTASPTLLETAYVFVGEGDGFNSADRVKYRAYTSADLESARATVQSLVARIAKGDFKSSGDCELCTA